MQIILYLSVAVIAIAFLVLVIFLSRTLKSLQTTLDSVSRTLVGLEQQLDGVTRETTDLLHKTNTLADDIQRKSESLNGIVNAVKDVGTFVQRFNHSIQSVTTAVDQQIHRNRDKISQIVQWSNVVLELKEKWQSRKQPTGLNQVEMQQAAAREQKQGKY